MSTTTQASTVDYVRTRKQFAEILGVSPATFTRLEEANKLPPRIKLSERRVGYRESDIRKFIASGGVAA